MNNPSLELSLFTNLLLLLVFSRIFGEILERFNQPAMIGEILAGIILGPSILNIIHRTEEIRIISELGIFFFVILAGVEINIDEILNSLRGKNIIMPVISFILPFVCGFGVGILFNLDITATFFLGLCISITALPVSVRILMDLGKLNTELGQKIISVAIFNDVLALMFFGMFWNNKNATLTIKSFLKVVFLSFLKLFAFIFILTIAYILVKKMVQKGNYIKVYLDKIVSILKIKEPLFTLFFIFILVFSTISENLGFHFIVGSFFASMLISESLIGKENLHIIQSSTSNIAMGLLAPIFFASIGLETNLFSLTNLSLVLVVLLIAFISKIISGYFAGRMTGLNPTTSLTLGVGLNARGIMELIIANIAFINNFINIEIFSILVLMGLVTTMLTPIFLKLLFDYKENYQ
ncbi:MAG: cation:proton antiporter [Leptospiraceae bacterium]|jgi:Kef-type K+ transport system membrane component KefB|nr:cation:proton antiporter [Leptospiraceae bacterium]